MSGTRGQVLVVKDDAGARDPVCAWLQAAGLGALRVGRASEALALLEGRPIDAVVLDLGLKGGRELLRTVHSRLPHVPVVVLTPEPAVAVECLEAGAHDYLVKPADETRLVTTVSNALRYRRLQDVLAALEQAGRGRAQGAEGPSEDAERPWRQAEGGLPIPVRGGRAAGRGPAVLLEGSLLLSEREREVIEVALQQAAGNRSEALRVLGIGRSTLYRKLKEHGLK